MINKKLLFFIRFIVNVIVDIYYYIIRKYKILRGKIYIQAHKEYKGALNAPSIKASKEEYKRRLEAKHKSGRLMVDQSMFNKDHTDL